MCVSSKPLGHDLLGNVMRKQSSYFRDRLCLSGGREGGEEGGIFGWWGLGWRRTGRQIAYGNRDFLSDPGQ